MRKAVEILVIGAALFMACGGIDFIYAFQTQMFLTKLTALSPVAMMLGIFGVVGIFLIHESSRNLMDEKLAVKQQTVGFIMILTVALLFELTYRIAMS